MSLPVQISAAVPAVVSVPTAPESAATGAAGPVVSGRVRVIDGDTFDVGGVRVRLMGIDAVERHQSCTKPDGSRWACGAWVGRKVTALYAGAHAECAVSDVDRYGRKVALCRVNGRDVARDLVRAGLAFAYPHYSRRYIPDQAFAERAGNGLRASDTLAPADWRRLQRSGRQQTAAHRVRAKVATPNGCTIKGNVSGKGTRIYHEPGQRDYAKTVISPQKGERWFCTRSEAERAGWRRGKR